MMRQLIATFDVQLPEEFRARLPVGAGDGEGGPVWVGPCTVQFGDLTISVSLQASHSEAEIDGETYRWVTHARLVVQGEESTEPPPDHDQRIQYFEDRRGKYISAASEVMARLLGHCKFKLFLPIETTRVAGLANPSWSDDLGRSHNPGAGHLYGRFAIPAKGTGLNLADLFGMATILSSPVQPSLPEELLSDAVCAWHERHLRRAVLECAISIETAVKGNLFSETAQHLDDTGRVRASVIELVSTITQSVIGRSFKIDDPVSFHRIELLFQARNKAAHKGQLYYFDDSRTRHEVDAPEVSRWIAAAKTLLQWLDQLQT